MKRNRILMLAVGTLAIVGQAQAVDYVWNGGTGAWNIATNWTPNGIPNALTDTIVVDDVTASAAIVNLPGSTTLTIGSGTLAANTNGGTNTINVANNTDFVIDTAFTNHGLISVNATGSLTHLYVRNANTLFAGTGTVRLASVNSRIGAGLAGAGFNNGVGHTVAGFGNFGINTLNIVNAGSVLADVAGQSLQVDPIAFTNSGTLGSVNGATLDLFAGTYTNTGTINAGTGSTVMLQNGAMLTGGTIQSTGTGTVQVAGSATVQISSLTLVGQVNIQNNASLRVQNTITNNAILSISATGSLTDITQLANTTFAGNGEVKLASVNSRIGGAFTLTNTATHLIHGYGNVGINQSGVINNGIIRADVVGQALQIDPGDFNLDAGGNDFLNNNTLAASAGATLELYGAGYANAGTITANGADARVRLYDGARIVGGTVSGISGGKVVGAGSANVGLQNVTVVGAFETENNSDLELRDTITNNGTINVIATGSLTDVELNNAVTLTGSGTLRLSGANAGVNTVGATHTLTHAANHTIAGVGRLGQNVTGFINDGLIVADVAAGQLQIDPANADVDGSGSDFLNRKTIRATGGGIAGLYGADYTNNASGVIEATGAGSVVRLFDNARITGGTVRGTGGGTIIINGSDNAGFANLTVEGNVVSENNTDLELRGTILNNGSISVNATGSLTDVELNSNVALNGTGTLTLNGINSGVNAAGGTWTLTQAAAHTIAGNGRLAQNTMGVINNGIIRGNVVGQALQIDPANVSLDVDGNDLLNNNLIQASNGGFVSLFGGDYVNSAGGMVEATGAGSVVRFHDSARIAGGKIRSASGGTIVVNASENIGFRDLTIEGTVNQENNSDLELRGTITNNGNINVNATGSLTDIELNSNVTIAGLGRVDLTSINSGINGAGGAWTLTNAAGHTLAGRGNIGRDTIRIINNGVIQADINAATLTIDPTATTGGTNYGFVNNNTLAAINGGRLSLTGGDFYNDGLVRVDPGAQLLISASGNFIHGPNSTLIQSGDVVIESGGTFTNAGIFSPANVGTNGSVTMTGAFVNAPTGRLVMDIAGTTPVTQHDQIVGTGATTLAGTLELNLIGGFDPTLYGTPIVLIRDNSGSNITGRFDQILNFDLGATKKLAVIYGPLGSATANQVYVVAAMPGDTDVNGQVNFDDLLALAQNYGTLDNMSWQSGDFNADGATNFDDLLPLAQNYGFGTPGLMAGDFAADWALAQSMVPEPTSLFAMGLLAAFSAGRRR